MSGCGIYAPEEISGKSLTIYHSRNAVYYVYRDKVALTMPYSDEKTDILSLRTDKSAVSWINCGYTILNGKFQAVGWYDDKLFILMNSVYYFLT